MLPDMSDVVTAFEQPVKLRRITQTVVDHRPVESVETTSINAVIQPAQKEKLQIGNIDWSLRYLMVHSKASFDINDLIQYKSIDYKIVDLGDYDDYGFHESVAEEVK